MTASILRTAVSAAMMAWAGVRAQAAAPSTNAPPPTVPVIVEFFFEAGCTECFEVRTEVLPRLEASCRGFYTLKEHDIGIEANYLMLAAYLKRFGIRENAPVFMVVDGEDVLPGAKVIADRLVPLVEQRAAARLNRPVEPLVQPTADKPVPRDTLVRLMAEFTLAGILLAGLTDGINPCAFSTLVFLISVLSLSRARGAHLLRIGAVFCLATFVTYTAIGFGLLHALRALSVFPIVQRVVDYVLLALLFGLAAISFRDAFRFWKTGNPKDVSLQLPDKLKHRIHRMVRAGFGEKAQLASAFFIGMAVTALESVCTGQLYAPTLAMIVRTGTNLTQALGYLLAYNVMFVVPLVAVFLLTYNGLRLATLLEWSSTNVVVSKVALGLFFLGLAVLMVFLI